MFKEIHKILSENNFDADLLKKISPMITALKVDVFVFDPFGKPIFLSGENYLNIINFLGVQNIENNEINIKQDGKYVSVIKNKAGTMIFSGEKLDEELCFALASIICCIIQNGDKARQIKKKLPLLS